LKQSLFTLLHQEYGRDAEGLANDVWNATELIDKLALHTMEIHQTTREAIINVKLITDQVFLTLSEPYAMDLPLATG
jgi:rsbT co-antagonist protein RsbR